MRRLSVPPRLRLMFIWGAAFFLLLALRFEIDYRDSLAHLPALVDEHGIVASLQTAMSGLDSYEQAKEVRRSGFVSLGLGVLCCTCGVVTGSRRKEPHAAQPAGSR